MHLDDFMAPREDDTVSNMYDNKSLDTNRHHKSAMSINISSTPSHTDRTDISAKVNRSLSPVGLLKVGNTVSVLESNASVTPVSSKDRAGVYATEDPTSTPESENLHSYRLWFKEKQMREDEEKAPQVKHEDEESPEESFRVEAVLERGPSPPESENGNSYEWSYEEQFKQLYEIDTDPERKSFLDEYFEFMKSRGTPVSRIPIMAKQILDLYQLYNLVVKHGGLVQVIRNKQWSKITKGLNLPTSITSAAFTLRTQYLKYLYPYECSLHNFSTPKELQAAIDSNRRDRFSTLYHTEPTMTPPRDDRFVSFPINSMEYPPGMPPRHLPHHVLPGSQSDVRYHLKRPGEPLISKPYDKYSTESPKVIVLQDGTSTSESRSGKVSPSYHARSRSPPPMRESDFRALAEMEVARRRSHFMHNGKDWDGDARHVLEEENRRRLMDDMRPRGVVCKDKNCNGVDCQYARPDIHRHRNHDQMLAMCACAYCKDYPPRSSSYSPSRRDHVSRDAPRGHHAEAPTMMSSESNGDTKGDFRGLSSIGSHLHSSDYDEKPTDTSMPTIKMRIPDVLQGGSGIHISIEVAGTVYEGVVSARPSTRINGDKDIEPHSN